MAAACFDSDGVVEMAAAGRCCENGEETVSVNSRFHIGSIAKPMTATVAATLVEEEMVAWDLSIGDAFPELHDQINSVFLDVTLRDLLMHRAGLAPWWSDADEFNVHNIVPGLSGTPMEQRQKFVEWLLQQEEYVPPGEIQYSNAGYTVASVLLERATGRPWEKLIQERLFPLGMTTAGFGWPSDGLEGQPCGHLRNSNGSFYVAPLEFHRIPSVFAPSGDLHMSIRDLAEFGAMHLRGLNGQDGLLKAATVACLHKPIGDYAYGWGVGTSAQGEKGSSHEGGAGTFYGVIGLSHEQPIGCVVVANVGAESARMAVGNIAVELLAYHKNEGQKPSRR